MSNKHFNTLLKKIVLFLFVMNLLQINLCCFVLCNEQTALQINLTCFTVVMRYFITHMKSLHTCSKVLHCKHVIIT